MDTAHLKRFLGEGFLGQTKGSMTMAPSGRVITAKTLAPLTLKAGDSVTVNGRLFKGPGVVEVERGVVLWNGEAVSRPPDGADGVQVTIHVSGPVANLSLDSGAVIVKGDVTGSVSSLDGNVTVHGSVGVVKGNLTYGATGSAQRRSGTHRARDMPYAPHPATQRRRGLVIEEVEEVDDDPPIHPRRRLDFDQN